MVHKPWFANIKVKKVLIRFAHSVAEILVHTHTHTELFKIFQVPELLGNMVFQIIKKVFFWIQNKRLVMSFQGLHTEPLLFTLVVFASKNSKWSLHQTEKFLSHQT